MGFPRVLAEVQRASLHADVLAALDSTEAVHRALQKAEPHLVGLTPATFAELRTLLGTAYDAIAKARTLTDTRTDDAEREWSVRADA